MLLAQMPIRKIGIELKRDTRMVVRIGVKLGFFPQEQLPKRRPYLNHPKTEASFDEKLGRYRKRWLDAITLNPGATRTDLRQIDSRASYWLRKNDSE